MLTKTLKNSREGVVEAIKFGQLKSYDYMFVCWDTWDEIFYASYVDKYRVSSARNNYSTSKFVHMIELYDLRGDIEEQLDAGVAMAYVQQEENDLVDLGDFYD